MESLPNRAAPFGAEDDDLGRRESQRLVFVEADGALISGRARPIRGRVLDLSRGGALFEPKRDRCELRGPTVLKVTSTGQERDVAIPLDIVRARGGKLALRWQRRLSDTEFRDLARMLSAPTP